MKCPKCKHDLDIVKRISYCKYCGMKIVVSKDVENLLFEIIKAKVKK